VPFPWITTSTFPFCKIYQDLPSSPWLNTMRIKPTRLWKER
jgi:hypothetical protein